MTANIRIDLPRPASNGPPPLTRRDRECDAVLYHCPDCGRAHLVALECPPINAPIAIFQYAGRKYNRVVESVT